MRDLSCLFGAISSSGSTWTCFILFLVIARMTTLYTCPWINVCYGQECGCDTEDGQLEERFGNRKRTPKKTKRPIRSIKEDQGARVVNSITSDPLCIYICSASLPTFFDGGAIGLEKLQ